MVFKDGVLMKLGSGLLRPRWLAALGALVVAGGLLVALYGRDAARAAGAAQSRAAPAGSRAREAVLTVTAAELRPVEVARSITINGSLFAWQEVIIAPEVGGYRVAEVRGRRRRSREAGPDARRALD